MIEGRPGWNAVKLGVVEYGYAALQPCSSAETRNGYADGGGI